MSDDHETTIRLIRDLYAIHPVGGPLHVELDDMNLDGVITPWYDGYSAEELDALHYQGWPIADLPPEAPVVIEGIGVSMRQLCDQIAANLNAMPVEDREALVERFHDTRA